MATRSWLVLGETFQPRYLVVYSAAVHRETGETHMLYRIDQHALERDHRCPLAWVETYVEAEAWCREQIETPNLDAPIRDGYGSAITPDMQRERWAAGLDPRTGKPR
ncbi:hypothetical protein [Microbacterium sp. P05]|uniref:hypothetical protein n=1 Tax=Microbacterium sp. P05 TaxID=3366948 RepID=UPI003746202F